MRNLCRLPLPGQPGRRVAGHYGAALGTDPETVRHGQKESTRWIEGYERVAEMAAEMPDTRLVYVADREADLMAMIARALALGTPVDWLMHAKHNRCLPEGDGEKLWANTTAGAALGEITFTMPARDEQKSPNVRQQLWTRQLEHFERQGRHRVRHLHRGARNRRAEGRQVAPADEPRSADTGRRHRIDRLVPGALGNRDLFQCPQEWLQGRGAAAVGNRSHRTGAGIIHDRRLAGSLSV